MTAGLKSLGDAGLHRVFVLSWLPSLR